MTRGRWRYRAIVTSLQLRANTSSRWLEEQPSTRGHRRRSARVDRADDLGVVNSPQIDRRDAEVGVAELALDDVQRHALPGHLDGMGVTELVRSETASHSGVEGEPPKLCSCGRARPRAPASRPVDDAEERADRHPSAKVEPRAKLLPAPLVHPDLTPLAALAVADE